MQARLVERERLRRHMRYRRYLAGLETTPAAPPPTPGDTEDAAAPTPPDAAPVPEPEATGPADTVETAPAPETSASEPLAPEPGPEADPFSPQSMQRLIEALERDRPR